MQSSLGIPQTRGGELEANPEIKYIGIKSSSMNQSQVELMSLQYGGLDVRTRQGLAIQKSSMGIESSSMNQSQVGPMRFEV